MKKIFAFFCTLLMPLLLLASADEDAIRKVIVNFWLERGSMNIGKALEYCAPEYVRLCSTEEGNVFKLGFFGLLKPPVGATCGCPRAFKKRPSYEESRFCQKIVSIVFLFLFGGS